jgi:hypothetical protein
VPKLGAMDSLQAITSVDAWARQEARRRARGAAAV